MAEPNWRLADKDRFGRARRPKASRVTDNMSEFVTKGKLTEAEKRREGRKTKTGRKATPRDAWGDKRPVTKSTGGKDSARQKRIETVRKYNKRAYGGVNPKVTSSGDVGARAIKDRRAKLPDGGQKYKPITESDGPRGGGSKYQSRTQRVKRSYAAGTEGSRKITSSDDFYPRDKGRVTRGRGKKVAGYMTDKVRGVDPPKGPSRRAERGPLSREKDFEGRTRQTKRGHIGSTRKGSKTGQGRYSSGTANATGARRTGGGKTPMKGAGQPRTETKTVNKPKMNQKGKVKANTVLKGVVSLLSKRFNHAMTAADIWKLGKTNSALDKALKRIPDTSDRDAGRLLGNKIVALATAAFNKKKTKRSVANLPSGYKQSEKKAFKEAKKWKRVNRKKR